MSYEQGMRLATRSIALYLLLWAFSDLLAMPRELMRISDVVTSRRWAYPGDTAMISRTYQSTIVRDELGFLLTNLLCAVIWIALARWIYRCGPKLQLFFGVDEEQNLPSRDPPQNSPS